MYRLTVLIKIIFLVVWVASGWASTFYVDATSGNDAAPGTQDQPWQHCPGMNGWTGSAILNAGDVVYFNNEDTWIAEGGGADFLSIKGGVTYDGTAWGSGTRAKFIANTGFYQGIIYVTNDHEIFQTVIKGFHLDINNQAVYAGVNINRGGSLDLIGSIKKVEDCVVHDGTQSTPSYGILVGASNDHKTNNVEILNNTVYNITYQGISIYLSNGSSLNELNNAVIRGNKVYNCLGTNNLVGNGIHLKNHSLNVVIEFNHLHDNFGRGIMVENDPTPRPGPENVIIRNNIIERNGKGGIIIAQNSGKSVEIYGNLIFNNFNNASGGTGIHFQSDLGGIIIAKIYNNTLFQNANGEISIANSSANFSTLDIKNNILSSLSGKYPLYNAMNGAITASANNIYYRPDGGNLIYDGNVSYNPETVYSWESTALVSDPLFKDVGNLPSGFLGTFGRDMRPNAEGLQITPNSPGRDYGFPLGSSYVNSINSITRNNASNWDLGAYEFGNGTKILPPRNFRQLN